MNNSYITMMSQLLTMKEGNQRKPLHNNSVYRNRNHSN